MESDRNKRAIAFGVVLVVCAVAMNYFFEHNNVLAVWENSSDPVGWTDFFYPVLCVFLSLTGVIFVIGGMIGRTANHQFFRGVLAIAVPLTVLYGIFAFAVQAVQTGADRLGECPGLDQAASSSDVIPEATWMPGHAAVACGVERRGIFLTYYNQLWVYGVINPSAQQRVLDKVAAHFQSAHTHPVQVMFYETGNVLVRRREKGAVVSGSPGKLIRVVDIG